MISFNGFLENKKAENTIRECANLLAERNVDPYVYIYESLKEIDPVFAENWWDGVKSTASNLWQGVKQFGGNVAQGVKAGYNQAADTISGPVVKFDNAVRALDDLLKVLNSDGVFQKFQSSSGQGNVIQYIEKVKKDLLADKGQIPQRTDTKVSQPYDSRDNVNAQRNPNEQQPQAQSQAQQPATRSWDVRSAGRL